MDAGPERMAEMVTMLTAASEVLAALTVRLSTASADEMPALAAEAKATMERIVKGCTDIAALGHLAPEDAATARDELVSLGRTLEAQLAGIVDLRWAQLASGGWSFTQH
jgi:phage host-nuclease inhibitor protein Gam